MADLKITELASKNISLSDFMIKADSNGLMTKNTVENLSNVLNTVGEVGFKGSVASTDATVGSDGWYFAEDSGTYTNNGGLIIDLSNNLAIIIVSNTQTTFSKIDIPLNITFDATPTEGSTNAPTSGGVFDAIIANTNLINSEAILTDALQDIQKVTTITEPTWVDGFLVSINAENTNYSIVANAVFRYVKQEIPTGVNAIDVRRKYSFAKIGIIFVDVSDNYIISYPFLIDEDYTRSSFEIPSNATHFYYSYLKDSEATIDFDYYSFYFNNTFVNKSLIDVNLANISLNNGLIVDNINAIEGNRVKKLDYTFVSNSRWDTSTGVISSLAFFNGYLADIPLNTKSLYIRVSYTSGNTGIVFRDAQGRWCGGIKNNDALRKNEYFEVLVPKNATSVNFSYQTDAQAIIEGVPLWSQPFYILEESDNIQGKNTRKIADCVSNPTDEKATHTSITNIVDDRNKIVTVYSSNPNSYLESAIGESMKLSVYNQLEPYKRTVLNVASPGETIGGTTLPTVSSLFEPFVLNKGDGFLNISFYSLASNQYYMRRFEIATNNLEDSITLLKIKVGAIFENFNSTNVRQAIRDFRVEPSFDTASYMQLVSRIISYNGKYYGYLGGYFSSATLRFGGALVESTDGINWEVVYSRDNSGGAFSYSETDICLVADTLYCVQRYDDDDVMGRGSCMFTIDMTDYSATSDIPIGATTFPSTGRPALFKDRFDNVYACITNGDINTSIGVVQRTQYGIYKVNTATTELTFKQVATFKNDGGIHYGSVLNNEEELLISYSTDRRGYVLNKGGDRTHPTNNIDLITLSFEDINLFTLDPDLKI
jgi:hypothetical protein